MNKIYTLTFTFSLFSIGILNAQTGRVGIGESAPGSKGSIKGNLSVGSTYSNQAAPVDGAIIEGKTGIGKLNPDEKLDVTGNIKASDKVIGVRGIVAGDVTADTAKAVFSTNATNKGFYIPRLTTPQKTTLGVGLNNTNKGLIVFDNDLNRMEFWDGTAWKAVGDGAGGAPTGAAGGDLSGSYPNPTVANNAINSAKILDGSVTGNDIQNNTIDLSTKVNNVLPVSNGGSGVNTIIGAVIGNGGSPMSGVAATAGNQVLRRNNSNNAYEFAQVQYTDIAGTPSGLPPTGTAGGDLSGSYPNPVVANSAITGAKIQDGTITNSDISDVAWNKVTGTPTTLSGYGITDAVPSGRSITINQTSNQTTVSGGTQDLSGNRTWTVGTVQDIATTSSPTFNNITSTGNFIGRNSINDTRSTNAAPNTYSRQLAYEFKERATIGSPGTGTYGGLITIAPWSDNSGNNDHQLFFNDGGIFHRQGNAAGTLSSDWGSWSQLLTSANNPSISGTNNYVSKFTSSNTIGNSQIQDNGTNVGIGDAPGTIKLKVAGDIEATGQIRATGWLTGSGTGQGAEIGVSGGQSYFFGYNRTTSTYTPTRLVGSTIDLRHSDASSDLFISTDGNVGIGTASPGAYKLNVQAGGANSIIQSTSDAPLELRGTDTWSGIKFKDVSGEDYIWFNGANSTYAIGGGGSNVAGKKLHIDGGTSIGANYDGTATPTNGLAVEGTVRIQGGSPAVGRVLTATDANGNASWQPINGGEKIGGTVAAGTWYRIASNDGNRANAEFTLRDYISGGGHSTVNFRVGTSYNDPNGVSFVMLSHSAFSVETFTKVRVLQATTYDPQYLEVYVERPGSVDFSILDNQQTNGWIPLAWTAGSIPGGYTAKEFSLSNVFTAGSNTNSLTVARNDNVGIGTTTPVTRLTIAQEGSYSFPNPGGNAVGAINIRMTTSSRQSGITFSSANANNAQAGIYVHQDNGTGTQMHFATTDNYTTGPQVRQTILNNGNVGIGTISPGARLEVNGQVKITGGSPAAGKFLKSDASGLASWDYATNPWENMGNNIRQACNSGNADLTYEWGVTYNNSGTILRVTCNRWNVGFRVCSYPPYPTGDAEPFTWGGVCWIWDTNSALDNSCSIAYHSYYYQDVYGRYGMSTGNGCDAMPTVYRRKL